MTDGNQIIAECKANLIIDDIPGIDIVSTGPTATSGA